jgi:hypothetical protein
MDLEIFTSGFSAKLLVQNGEIMKPQTLIGIIGERPSSEATP